MLVLKISCKVVNNRLVFTATYPLTIEKVSTFLFTYTEETISISVAFELTFFSAYGLNH